MWSRELDLARAAERRERSWLSAARIRTANLQKAVEASVIAGDGNASRLRAELAIACRVERQASEEWSGARRIVRALSA
jgi:hypothetical protein